MVTTLHVLWATISLAWAFYFTLTIFAKPGIQEARGQIPWWMNQILFWFFVLLETLVVYWLGIVIFAGLFRYFLSS